MNTQYPAGTGFDPRYNRPRGQSVGQIGNIYMSAPPTQQEEEGITAGDVLANVLGAAALGTAGYFGGRALLKAMPQNDAIFDIRNAMNKGRGSAPEAPAPQPKPAPQSPSGGTTAYTKQAPRQTSVSRESVSPEFEQQISTEAMLKLLGKARTASSDSQPVISSNPEVESSVQDAMQALAQRELDKSRGVKLLAPAREIAQIKRNPVGGVGNIFSDLSGIGIPSGQGFREKTLTDVQKIESQNVGQTAQANQVATELSKVIPTPDAQDFAEAYVKGNSGQGDSSAYSAVDPVEPVAQAALPKTVKTRPIRPSETLEPGGTINYGGKDQFILDNDGKYAFIEDDDGNVGALRILSGQDTVFEPEDISIEDYVSNSASGELSGTQKKALDLQKPSISYAKEISKTLGIPLKDASDSLAVQMGLEAARGNTPVSKYFIADPSEDQIAASNAVMSRFREAKKLEDVQKAIKIQDGQNSREVARREIKANEDSKSVFNAGNATEEKELERPGLETLGKEALDEIATTVFSPKTGKDILLLTPGAALTAYATPEFDIPIELGRRLTGVGEDGQQITGVKPLIAKTPDEYTTEDKLTLFNIKKIVDNKAKEGVAATVAGHLISGGELVDGQRKGLGWLVSEDPTKTRVRGLVPGERKVSVSGKQKSTKYDFSDQSAIYRNALTGEVGNARELGISNGRGASGADSTGISNDLGRFIVGFENPLKGLTRINSTGSGKNVVRPSEDIVGVIGETDADLITRGDRTTNMTPEVGLKRLIKEMRDGRTTFTAEGSYGGYERATRRNPFYNDIKVIPETPEGLVQAVGDRKIRLDKNGKPFVVPGRATSMSIEGARTKAAIDKDESKYGTYAPAGVDGTGNKIFKREIAVDPYDEYIGEETAAYLQSLGQDSLEPSQKQHVDRLIEIAKQDPGTLNSAAALLRMSNDAAKNSNTAGARINRIIERGLDEGVELSSVLPNLVGSVPGGDFYSAFTSAGNKSSVGRTVQESIPVTINRALKTDEALGANALAAVIDSSGLGGAKEGQRIVSQLKDYVDGIALRRKEQSAGTSVLAPFRTGSGSERHEQRKVQVPSQPVVTGLRDEVEEAIGQTRTGGKGFGNQNISNRARTYQNNKQKEKQKAAAERRADRRVSTLDSINEILGNNAEYVAQIDSEASEEQARKYAYQDSALDDLLKSIQSGEDLDQATIDRVSASIDNIEGIESAVNMIDSRQDQDMSDEYVYARPSIQPKTGAKDPENRRIAAEYLTKVRGGVEPFNPITIRSNTGAVTLDLTDAGKERAMQTRVIDDPSGAVGPNGKPVKKWLGGYVKPSAQNIRDYWVPEETRTHWTDLAERNPDGIYAIAAREGISPVEMQTRILDNPDGYSEKVLLQAARQLDPEYEYSARSGMSISPVVAKAVDIKMQQMGLPPSNEIKNYVESVSMPGYEYSGNSPIELAGRAAAETAGGLNDKRSLSLKIKRPGAQEAGTSRSVEYAGGMLDDSEGSASATLQRIIGSNNNATGSTSPVKPEMLDPSLPVGQQLGQILGLTQDLESDPVRDALFYKKDDGRFGLTPLGRKLKSDDQNSERPALHGKTALSTVLPREAKEQQAEVRRGERRAAKQEVTQEALQKLSNELADVPTGENLGGSALNAINQILGKGGSKEVKNINQALKRAGLRTTSREPERIPALEILGDPKSGEAQYIQTQAVIADPYEGIESPRPPKASEARRGRMQQQQEQNRSNLVNQYLTGVSASTPSDGSQVPLVQAQSILDQTGMGLREFMDTFGTDPTSVARELNQRTSARGRSDRSQQRSLFNTAPYRSEGLQTYMNNQGRITRGTSLDVAQSQNVTQQQMMGNRNRANTGDQLQLPGLGGVRMVNLNG